MQSPVPCLPRLGGLAPGAVRYASRYGSGSPVRRRRAADTAACLRLRAWVTSPPRWLQQFLTLAIELDRWQRRLKRSVASNACARSTAERASERSALEWIVGR